MPLLAPSVGPLVAVPLIPQVADRRVTKIYYVVVKKDKEGTAVLGPVTKQEADRIVRRLKHQGRRRSDITIERRKT
jgi:hypothetical protein